MSSSTLPTLFVSHGSPMTALEPREAGAFMQRLGPAIASLLRPSGSIPPSGSDRDRETAVAIDAASGRPRAVLAISAHTLARVPVLLAAARHAAVYDFGGFDPQLYTLRYDAPGAPALAAQAAGLLRAAGIDVQVEDAGGLDHGIWTPLRYVYPDADVPVLPLAFPPDWSPARLFALGRALAPLAADGVLVMGTGSITHNLRMVFGGGTRPAADAPEMAPSAAFRAWVERRAAAADWPALLDYRAAAPHAVLMHPSDEHWLPWYVAAGAAGERPRGVRLHASVTFGCLGMDAYAFGAAAPRLAEALAAPANA